MEHAQTVQAPFPWFGGKSRVAPIVWQAFGDVANYVEPFFGSGAVLLGRPTPPHIETVNDLDGFVCNAWRAIQHDPHAVAHYADSPVNECDLHARHCWLVARRAVLSARLMGDPEYYDAKIAGWWLWGISCWIGGGWCSGNGPWHSVDGLFLRQESDGRGVPRQRVHLGDAGRGVHRQRVHLGNASIAEHRPQLAKGQGLVAWMEALCDRMRGVRICCGDWQRVLGPCVTYHNGVTGILLDPPYSHAERDSTIYAEEADIAQAVGQWAINHGDTPNIRIILCGYEGEHIIPPTWRCVPWKAHGGYGNRSPDGRGHDNATRERLWLSPGCLDVEQRQLGLF